MLSTFFAAQTEANEKEKTACQRRRQTRQTARDERQIIVHSGLSENCSAASDARFTV